MLKEAIQYLVSLKDNKTYQINGETYSDRELVRVAPHVDRPGEVRVNGLDSIVKLVSHELDMLENLPVYIRVVSPRQVEVFSTLDSVMGRDDLYVAVCDAPDFAAGKWMPHENAIIALRSAFVPNEGTEYLLDLLSRISKEDGVTTEDNGVSQTVSARQGIALKRFEQVRQRIALRPYRTFTEVEQPESEFITVQTSGGSTFYIVIDYDKPVNEEEEQYQTYFLSTVDEDDLLAAIEKAGGELPACTCTEKCAAGAVNTDCPVCATNMTECGGVAPEPEPTEPEEPEPETGGMGPILLILAVALVGGGAGWYFKIYRPKQERAAQAEEDYDEPDPYEEPEDYDPYGEDEYGDEEETEEKD